MEDSTLDSLRDQLVRKAYLYGDPTAYEAGVDAVLAILAHDRSSESTDSDLAPVLSVTH
ncbi:hypothetical protein [Euzebya tangerina]|uniref:hypothetical protein n=1 Tax=Euzebya tangerina TaxID=591198 RepID=UPI0013C30C90|nr:hypothetical protein [Euzebya tangerina]